MSAAADSLRRMDPSSLQQGQWLRCVTGYPERRLRSVDFHEVPTGSLWRVGYVLPEAVVLDDPQGEVAIAVAREDLAMWQAH